MLFLYFSLLVLFILPYANGVGVFNVLDYGAKGDGVTLDTAAIRAALAAAEQANGGIVQFPESYTFLTGSFNITSNIDLLIDGTILASNVTDNSNYVLVEPLPWYGGGQDRQMSGDLEWSSVLRSFNAENISLLSSTGKGVIDGNGDAWWACFNQNLSTYPCNGYSRPQLVRFINTKNVMVSNLIMRNSPSWTLHLANVSGGNILSLNVTAPPSVGNTDGIDIDVSSDILVSNFYYAGGDDAIAVKAGIDYLGRTFGRTTANIIVEGAVVESGNGISIGSEMSAGVENVTMLDVMISPVLGPIKHGPYLKSQRGRGGVVSNVFFSNWTVVGVANAIAMTLAYHPNLPPTNSTATPQYSSLSFFDFTTIGCQNTFNLMGLNDSVIKNVIVDGLNASDHNVGSVCNYVDGFCLSSNSCPVCFN
jgi:polygalacturonase